MLVERTLVSLVAASLSLQAAVTLAAEAVTPVFIAASDGAFSRPHDLVLSPDRRFLYVADVGNHAVKVLDPDSLETMAAIGEGQLNSPHDVAFDQKGRLLVADSGNDRIAIYAVRGLAADYLGDWREGLASPEGVVPAPDGRTYVTNARRHNIVVFEGGKRVQEAGSAGTGDNQYARPHDIEVAVDGTLYVTDPGNNRIQILSPRLEYQEALGGTGYDFNEPKYLAFDERGWLYVADEYNHQIKIFDAERRRVAVIGTGERGEAPDRLNAPEGVTVWRDRVWVADTHNHRILLYRLEGAPARQ
jgi:DNA-binding beta-propeller fold protein YncE